MPWSRSRARGSARSRHPRLCCGSTGPQHSGARRTRPAPSMPPGIGTICSLTRRPSASSPSACARRACSTSAAATAPYLRLLERFGAGTMYGIDALPPEATVFGAGGYRDRRCLRAVRSRPALRPRHLRRSGRASRSCARGGADRADRAPCRSGDRVFGGRAGAARPRSYQLPPARLLARPLARPRLAPNAAESMAMRGLASLSWFRRNLVVLHRAETIPDRCGAAALLDVARRRYAWYRTGARHARRGIRGGATGRGRLCGWLRSIAENIDRSRRFVLTVMVGGSGLEVQHVIHRHGLPSERVAFEVEAAVMDCFPAAANRVRGHGAAAGVRHGPSSLHGTRRALRPAPRHPPP